jgi:hypothetical protein
MHYFLLRARASPGFTSDVDPSAAVAFINCFFSGNDSWIVCKSLTKTRMSPLCFFLVRSSHAIPVVYFILCLTAPYYVSLCLIMFIFIGMSYVSCAFFTFLLLACRLLPCMQHSCCACKAFVSFSLYLHSAFPSHKGEF